MSEILVGRAGTAATETAALAVGQAVDAQAGEAMERKVGRSSHETAAFRSFELASWERAAERFAGSWEVMTREFGLLLLGALGVGQGLRLLDVACGPGTVTAAARSLGAAAVGVDFSPAMIRLARGRNPGPAFEEADAEALPFAAASFDRAMINFGVLHFADPAAAFREARRVLRPGGRLGFSVWAGADVCGVAAIVGEALAAFADRDVVLPAGPPPDRFADPERCREALAAAGFAASSLGFETRVLTWAAPDADFLFEAERWGGVRTAALLARQPAHRLAAIRDAVRAGVERHRTAGGFAVPLAAHLVTAEASVCGEPGG